ncbi:ribosome recycling factor family protein [Shewanella colwelliana]|uniref:ribosome recycling factor family protein n=1 Tax=Shewanella colwelliana TaxID=23 RepID=UPI0039DFD183
MCGGAIDIQSFTKQLVNFERFSYLVQKVETALLQHTDKLESTDAKLIRLIHANPSITLAELMEHTQCTISEARLARFQTNSW